MNHSEQYVMFQIAIDYINKPGPIKERIANAYNFNLIYIEPKELPVDISQRFVRVRNELAVKANQDNMSTEEAEAIALEIKSMALLLEGYLPES